MCGDILREIIWIKEGPIEKASLFRDEQVCLNALAFTCAPEQTHHTLHADGQEYEARSPPFLARLQNHRRHPLHPQELSSSSEKQSQFKAMTINYT